jgi:hypothetical protein
MTGDIKPKYQLLQEFAAVLFRRNPMTLSQDNPLEYESEALSILSRFNEAALQLADDEASVAVIATSIVKQSLEFWFDNIGDVDPEPIAREFVRIYRVGHGETVAEETEVDVGGECKPVTNVTAGE